MKRWSLVSLLLPVLWAASAHAQLTVVTDRDDYTAGEVVLITIHNAGPGVATFASTPGWYIRHVESGECIDGCLGLPMLWDMPAGQTIDVAHDTSLAPDLIGHYEVVLTGMSGDPGSILVAAYELMVPVFDTADTWGGVKSLFR